MDVAVCLIVFSIQGGRLPLAVIHKQSRMHKCKVIYKCKVVYIRKVLQCWRTLRGLPFSRKLFGEKIRSASNKTFHFKNYAYSFSCIHIVLIRCSFTRAATCPLPFLERHGLIADAPHRERITARRCRWRRHRRHAYVLIRVVRLAVAIVHLWW